MKDYLTIKEFSKLSGIETTTLRYWDEIGLFSPMKRDPNNNYRCYSPEQMIAVNFISVLSSLNVPLKTISEVKERSPQKIVRLIRQQEKWLDMEMRRLRECYSIIHARLEMMNYGIEVLDGFYAVNGVRTDGQTPTDDAVFVDINKISVLYREDSAYIRGPRNIFKDGEEFYESFMNFCNKADELRINLNFPICAMHENIKSFLKAPGKPDYFLSMDPTGNRKRTAGDYLIGFTRGYYSQFGDLPDRMAAYAKENSRTISGPVYVMYLHDEICVKDPAQYLAQISVMVTKEEEKEEENKELTKLTLATTTSAVTSAT